MPLWMVYWISARRHWTHPRVYDILLLHWRFGSSISFMSHQMILWSCPASLRLRRLEYHTRKVDDTHIRNTSRGVAIFRQMTLGCRLLYILQKGKIEVVNVYLKDCHTKQFCESFNIQRLVNKLMNLRWSWGKSLSPPWVFTFMWNPADWDILRW